jgi:hypothetical protein
VNGRTAEITQRPYAGAGGSHKPVTKHFCETGEEKMKTKSVILVLVMCALILSACQSTPPPATEAAVVEQPTNAPLPMDTSVPTDTALPTETPVPTNTALPTETPKPTNTPLPAGVLFRDDFNGEFQPGWDWENENPDKWTFTDDGWLQIIGEHDSLLEDPENYITINRGYCDLCQTGGNGIYMDYKISGKWGGYQTATDAEDVYLRLESKGNTISGYYALSPDQWERLGRFGNYFQFKKVGIGVSNVRAASDVVGLFDYFEISTP